MQIEAQILTNTLIRDKLSGGIDASYSHQSPLAIINNSMPFKAFK